MQRSISMRRRAGHVPSRNGIKTTQSRLEAVPCEDFDTGQQSESLVEQVHLANSGGDAGHQPAAESLAISAWIEQLEAGKRMQQ
jgi:hypothetical protein